MRATYIHLLLLTFVPAPVLASEVELQLPRWAGPRKPPVKLARRQVAVAPSDAPLPAPEALSPDATFSALKLWRRNQATLRLCDHRSARLGRTPPSRIRFRVAVDPRGQARVTIDTEAPISPAIARCYRTLASSWRYPSTGEAYTLHLSRIAPDRR